MKNIKKTIYSGMQPTGFITLGNYLGALKNWLKLQNNDEYLNIYAIADLHSLTQRLNPKEFSKQTLSFFTQYLACGLDVDKNILYIQSQVHEHAELNWILSTITYVGEMNRMTQFKDKSRMQEENINMGLMNYPILMASDILLFNTDLVPIGIDQKQHLEITRDIAGRFNNLYGNIFKIPEAYYNKVAAKIMSLQDPTKKMSKSDENPNATVFILDEPNVIRKKFKRAVTDNIGEVNYDPEKQPGVSNLLSIYASCCDISIEKAEKEFKGYGYAALKSKTAESVISLLEPVQKKYKELSKDKKYVLSVINKGQEKASSIAQRTMSKVKKKVGLL